MLNPKKIRNIMIGFSLGLLALMIVLVVLEVIHVLLAVILFIIIQIILSKTIQGISRRQFLNVRGILLNELDAEGFKLKMEESTKNDPNYTVMRLIKEQDYSLAFIYTGEFEEAKQRIDNINSKYDVILNDSPHNQFSTDILDLLVALFSNDPTYVEKFKKVEETLEKLEEDSKKSIQYNPNSFYNLVRSVYRMKEEDELAFINNLDSLTVFNRVTLIYFIIEYYQGKDEEKYQQYVDELRNYSGSLFFLKRKPSH